jgi:hypothetical protein
LEHGATQLQLRLSKQSNSKLTRLMIALGIQISLRTWQLRLLSGLRHRACRLWKIPKIAKTTCGCGNQYSYLQRHSDGRTFKHIYYRSYSVLHSQVSMFHRVHTHNPDGNFPR